MSPDDLLTTAQAAELFGVAPDAIRQRVHSLRLRPAEGTNPRTWRFRRSEVEARIAARDRHQADLHRHNDWPRR